MGNSNSRCNEPRLNLAQMLPHSRVNGPGGRCVLWVQGCRLHCAGCSNQACWPFEPRTLVAVPELAERILTTPDIEGVTYSGGEPFEQAAALSELSRRLRPHGLSIVAYSGYTYAELLQRDDPAIAELLAQVDVLIDGRFEQAQAAPLLWRGSRNQQVHFLTDRYRRYAGQIDREKVELEYTLQEQDIYMTGQIDPTLMQTIAHHLHTRYGIVLTQHAPEGRLSDGKG